ncbi:MAG: phosphatidylglycerophosphatase [Actinomycetota bacterium]
MKPVVAAFDLDGTLAERDTLVPFLRTAVGTSRLCKALGLSSFKLLRARFDRELRDSVKEAILAATIGGMTEVSLRAVGARYAPSVTLKEPIVEKLRAHQLSGHATVVVSASPTIYVDAIAARLGIEAVVATELEVENGCVTGRYDGRNCRAEEKLRRLESWLDGRDVELHAYGNSPDDEPMLERADHPVWI